MNTAQAFPESQSSTVTPSPEVIRTIFARAQRTGWVAALTVAAAAIPLTARVMMAFGVPVLSVPGVIISLAILTLIGAFTRRWARCSFLREERTKLVRAHVNDADMPLSSSAAVQRAASELRCR
jgi:uncharacterized membrane protein